MAVNKVDLYVTQILEDLDNGLTWLKRDDVGYGSIQEKYNAKDQQIVMIRKHPKLKDAETSIIVFTVIDDTNEGDTSGSTVEPIHEQSLESILGADRQPEPATTRETSVSSVSDQVADRATAEADLDAFASI